MSKNYLSKNSELRRGDSLMSNNGEWKAVFQDDGDFVLYGWKPVWHSNTHGTDAIRLCMLADCNLVMYNKCEQCRWQTDSPRQAKMCRLQLTNDGTLVVTTESEEIWNSGHNKGMK